MLLIGSLSAVACAFGPEAVARVGIGIAVVTAVLTVILLVRGIGAQRRAHALALAEAARHEQETMRLERVRETGVLAGLDSCIGRLKAKNAKLRTQVTDLTDAAAADRTAAQLALMARDRDIAQQTRRAETAEQRADAAEQQVGELRTTVTRYESEISATRKAAEDAAIADLLPLPQRVEASDEARPA